MQVTTEHSEAVGQPTGIGVVKGFLLDGIALKPTDVAPGNVEGAAPVVANLANSGPAVGNRAVVAAGIAAHPVPVELLVESAFANSFFEDFLKARQLKRPCLRFLVYLF
jgi:hypothetical protein